MPDHNESKEPEIPKEPSVSSREDFILVKRASGGDQRAYVEILGKYKQPLYFHVLRMVRDKEIIEDLIQEIFSKAFDNINSYNTNYAFSTWLYRIATNHTIDYLRRKKLKTLSLDEPFKTKDGELSIEIVDEGHDADELILRKQRSNILLEAIDQLPDKYKEVILLRHMEEKSYQEIAELMDLPLGTVKAHIFRARELLYKELKDKLATF